MITIEKVSESFGFFVNSEDLPELNIRIQDEYQLTNVIPKAIKYLFRHNEGREVRVIMEVPVFPGAREVQLDYKEAA